jgi:hypothetical protein
MKQMVGYTHSFGFSGVFSGFSCCLGCLFGSFFGGFGWVDVLF